MHALLRMFVEHCFHFMVSLIDPIQAILTKFRHKFTLLNNKPPTRLRTVRTEKNLATVSASINNGHQLSIREWLALP